MLLRCTEKIASIFYIAPSCAPSPFRKDRHLCQRDLFQLQRAVYTLCQALGIKAIHRRTLKLGLPPPIALLPRGMLGLSSVLAGIFYVALACHSARLFDRFFFGCCSLILFLFFFGFCLGSIRFVRWSVCTPVVALPFRYFCVARVF